MALNGRRGQAKVAFVCARPEENREVRDKESVTLAEISNEAIGFNFTLF